MPDVVTVEGPDAQTYLQGQITQDVRPLAVGAVAWTFVLEPTGRAVALARLQRTADDRYELVVDDGYGEALLARLQRFKLRVKAELRQAAGVTEPVPGPTAAERVATGWPAMGREIVPGETIPAETGITAQAVCFTKGCYTGQELVERMDSRQAAPPRRLVRVASAGADLADGTELTLAGKVVGRVTTAAGRQALAYVQRSVTDASELDGGVTLA